MTKFRCIECRTERELDLSDVADANCGYIMGSFVQGNIKYTFRIFLCENHYRPEKITLDFIKEYSKPTRGD